MYIIGAGLAGCIAGIMNPGAKIIEANSTIPDYHKAVLRFRDDKISKETGIPFKKVRVYKDVFTEDGFSKPTIYDYNNYSLKVTGKILSRSIVNLEPVTRYIAPPDFHRKLGSLLNDRIEFNSKVHHIDEEIIMDEDGVAWPRLKEPVVSTLPMPILAKILNYNFIEQFSFQKIKVARYKIEDCDVHQTIYYTDPEIGAYRATITGDVLMVEYKFGNVLDFIELVLHSFALDHSRAVFMDDSEQKFGKIAPIDDVSRKQFIYQQTVSYDIYSLGRFGIWKNILLDDVYEDIKAIQRMINKSEYERMKG